MMFTKFYILTRLGGHKTARARILKTSQIEQIVSIIWLNMGSTWCPLAAHSVCNIGNEYYRRIQLDSHADTTVLSFNCVILTYTGKECKVSPHRDEYKSIQNVPVVNVMTAWTYPHSFKTFILVFNVALWMGHKFYHTLLNTNQMRHHRISLEKNLACKRQCALTALKRMQRFHSIC